MIKIDLITGFLGSGKTTFLRGYAGYLLKKGLHIGIIENDFGAINVDRLLLQDLEGENCEIEQVVGGNVVADWKRRFKSKLIALSMCGVQRVVVEPSGIYDAETFFDVLYDEPVCKLYEIGNIFAVVDAALAADGNTSLSVQAEYLLMTQVAHSGQVLLRKAENATPQQLQQTEDYLSGLLQKYGCNRDISGCVLAKPWPALTDGDYERLLQCGWARGGYKGLHFDENAVFTPLFFMNLDLPESEIRPRIEALFAAPDTGNILRAKGFFALPDGRWLEVNATKESLTLRHIAVGQKVIIVIGENLVQDKIQKYLEQ